MQSETIPLQIRFNESKTLFRISLPELCGNDELSVDGIDTAAGLNLLARLCKSMKHHSELNVYELSASQRDLMWAAMHRQYWGNRIVSSICCNACGADFDLSFLLTDLQKNLWSTVQHNAEVFAPTGMEEVYASEQHVYLDEQIRILTDLCLKKNSTFADEHDVKGLGQFLSEQAPIMDVDLKAVCTECNHENTVRFDVQSFVLQKIMNGQDALWFQVDALAKKYQWSLTEILSLSRSVRQQLSQ